MELGMNKKPDPIDPHTIRLAIAAELDRRRWGK